MKIVEEKVDLVETPKQDQIEPTLVKLVEKVITALLYELELEKPAKEVGTPDKITSTSSKRKVYFIII